MAACMMVAGWRVIVKRIAADWLILSAAIVTILLAITLLASGPIYSNSVTVAGASQTMSDAPVTESNLSITVDLRANGLAGGDELVTSELDRLLGSTGGEIVRSGQSDPHNLPDELEGRIEGEDEDEQTRNILFRFSEQFQQHASLTEGTWPQPGGDVIESVVPAATAEMFGLEIGEVFSTQSRLPGGSTVTFEIAGIYQINQSDDPYWYADTLALEGIDSGGSLTTHGPFVVHETAFSDHLMDRPVGITWRAYPNYEQLQVEDIPAMRSRASNLEASLASDIQDSGAIRVETRIPALLNEIDQSLLATRSSVFILTVQLAILAGYALILTANLLVESRRLETSLLRSRGAGVRQVLGLSLLEGLILVGPAIVIGPWIAAFALRLLNHAGPLAAGGIEIDPRVSLQSYLFAGVAGIGCILLLAIPAVFSARSIMGARAGRGRTTGQPLWQRAGIDLVLVAVAALGFFQLRRYGSPLTETVQGQLAIDPLLVAAPAIGLLAGAILALRLIPLLGRAGERWLSPGRQVVPAFGAWQIARRPGRYARSALLLILALGIGLFAVSYSHTWSDAQADQADYQIGADVTVRPRGGTGVVPQSYLQPALNGMDGVSAAIPVEIGSALVPTGSGSVRSVLLDSERATDVVSIRDDLSSGDLASTMNTLTDARPEMTGIDIPGTPQRIALDLELEIDRICSIPQLIRDEVGAPGVHTYETYSCEDHPGLSPHELQRYDGPITPVLLLKDGAGGFFRVNGEPIAAQDAAEQVEFPLAAEAGGLSVLPTFPLTILAIEFSTNTAPGPEHEEDSLEPRLNRSGTIHFDRILTSEEAQGDAWNTVLDAPNAIEWQLATSSGSGVSNMTISEPEQEQTDRQSVSFASGYSTPRFNFAVDRQEYPAATVTFRLVAAGATPSTDFVLPVIISERFRSDLGLEIGDELNLLLENEQRRVEVAGIVESFPTIDPTEDALVIADWQTLNTLRVIETGRTDAHPASWWIAAEPGMDESLAAALEEPPYSAVEVQSRFERARSLRADPVALGTLGSLSLGFVAATIFAVIGFISSAAVAARERMTEFALLRAIGLSPRQLAGWLLLENGFLVLVSLLGGTALGLLLSWLILPLITVSREAEQVFPDLIVVIPWNSILLLEAGVLALLLFVSGIVTLVLRRVGLGALLRIGED